MESLKSKVKYDVDHTELVGAWAGFTFVSPEELAGEQLTTEDLEILVGGVTTHLTNCPSPVPAAITKMCLPGTVVCAPVARFSCS
jgi:hypothetical protein